MCDHDPNDETVLPQPATGRLATRNELVGPSSPRGPLTAEEAALVAVAADPISPQEIAEMRNAFRRTTPGRWNWWTSNSMYRLSTTHDGKDGGVLHAFIAKDGVPDISMSQADRAFVEMAHERFPALLDAIEALTAKNQRLTDALNTTVQEATTAIDDKLKPEIERLTAENARLTSENVWQRTEMEAAYGDLTNSLMTGFDHGRPTAKELQGRIQRAKVILETAIFGRPSNWYATQRTKVEADAVAAKIAKRQAECRNCRDGFPAYVNPADWGTCPDCGKKFGAAAKKAPTHNPLDHPEYPALVEMVRESMRDGD